ncbi:hypothetical protein ID866_1214 [Astraeus odoratus]|nr:hypothetical protein ID866_1214 [Astraeus odoratus]
MPKDISRSQSAEADLDSEVESHADLENQSHGPSRPGRKKNPNSQAARRDQNRIAQREFRLRKQQKIRDLEARVELLSASQDEALTDLRAILKDLMAENLLLRNLLKSVASFISEGAGGFTAKLGWEMHEFEAFLNKSETDTAWESFQARKRSQKTTSTTETMTSTVGPQTVHGKRPSEDDTPSARLKKARGMSGAESTADRHDGYQLLIPMGTTVPPPPPPAASSLYPSAARSPQENIFSDLMRNGHANSPVFMPPASSGTPGHYSTPSTSSSYSSYIPQMNLVDQGMNAMSYPQAKNGTVPGPQRILSQATTASEEPDDDEELTRDQKRLEAIKLIRYHLDNYTRNRQFSLADCLYDYKRAVKVHGDDVLAHSNWELMEWWLRKYSYLVEKATLDICNRWRRERGEAELTMSDIGAQGESPAS